MSKEKLSFDTITAKMVIGQLFKSCNTMRIVKLKTNSSSIYSASDVYCEKLLYLVDDLCKIHFGAIGKKELDEIPSSRYIDPDQHLVDINRYLQSNRSLFKTSSEQLVIDKILTLILKTKYELTLQ